MNQPNKPAQSVAVLIPCFNEEKTVARVIEDFRSQLPQAQIYVFDNNSTDRSAEIAKAAGAMVVREKRQGKGYVVSAMLRKVDVDIYVMVDGDDTYPAEYVHQLMEPVVLEEADMVVGERLSVYSEKAFRPFHRIGNHLVCTMINSIFNSSLHDPMSGYRVFTREVAEAVPVVARGFDVETEMTLQLLNMDFSIKEISVPYRSRPEGSVSKLRTYSDGLRVILKIISILRAYKPLTFFGGIGLLFITASLGFGSVPIWEYFRYHFVYSVPMAILAAGLMTVGFLFFMCGLIITTVNFRLFEIMSLLTKQHYRQRRFSGRGRSG
jgi:glycosyltransferase involved in cell wall biosynthesis